MPSDRDRSMIDELRQKVCDLQELLNQEKVKNKQIHHDKVSEIKHIKEQEQARWEKDKITLKKKYLKEKNDAVNKILDNLKKKDKGVGDLLNQKDEEIRILQAELQRENDALSSSSCNLDLEARENELRDQFEAEKARLMQSMFELRTEKMRLEEELDIVKDADRDKAIQIRQMHDTHHRELSAIKRSSAVENRKQMEELRSVERKVMDKEKEISRKSKRLSQIEMSKEELQDKLNEQKLSERINLSMSMVDLNSSFSPHTAPIIKPRGRGLTRSSSSYSYGKLSRASSSSSVNSSRKSLNTPPSPKMGARPPVGPKGAGERKLQEDKEKGLQQRNAELSMRVKQLEDRIASITNENETLRQNGGGGEQAGRKRRISLSSICANLEEKNQELTQQNSELESKLRALQDSAAISMDDKPLADKLKMQEKEKLLIERTLSQLLTQSNIKLPPDVRENIENQALQLELNEALADDKQDNHLIDQLKSKIVSLEGDYQRLANKSRTREQELKNSNVELGQELSALKDYKVQLADQLSTTKAVMKTLSTENAQLKERVSSGSGNADQDRQARQMHDLRNEVQMLREEKQRMLDGEASARQKIKLLEEVQMELVKKEEKNSRYYDEVSQKLSLITKEKKELAKRVEEYEQQRRYEAEEMASMLNDRNEYLDQLEKSGSPIQDSQDKEYLKKECESYRLSNVQLESRLQKMEAKISPDKTVLVNRITELEEATEVKTRVLEEAKQVTLKKQHNEELQRVIRTLDKKNKEHNQKSEELRSHIKRLETDLRSLEQSKMENSGNLQIKAQELQRMSEYVKELEVSERDLRSKLELYQKTTVNGNKNLGSAFS